MVMHKKLITHFAPGVIKRIDKLIDEKGYTNRQEVVRMAVRDFLKAEENWILKPVAHK